MNKAFEIPRYSEFKLAELKLEAFNLQGWFEEKLFDYQDVWKDPDFLKEYILHLTGKGMLNFKFKDLGYFDVLKTIDFGCATEIHIMENLEFGVFRIIK